MYIGRILESKPIAMKDFDPLAVAKLARRHLETIEEPRRRQILENFIEHAETEATGDFDALMASCSKKEQHYATYGSRFGAPQSYEELEKHYRGLIESNIYLIHFEAEKLVVGRRSGPVCSSSSTRTARAPGSTPTPKAISRPTIS
jgi:hypothetical protein